MGSVGAEAAGLLIAIGGPFGGWLVVAVADFGAGPGPMPMFCMPICGCTTVGGTRLWSRSAQTPHALCRTAPYGEIVELGGGKVRLNEVKVVLPCAIPRCGWKYTCIARDVNGSEDGLQCAAMDGGEEPKERVAC